MAESEYEINYTTPKEFLTIIESLKRNTVDYPCDITVTVDNANALEDACSTLSNTKDLYYNLVLKSSSSASVFKDSTPALFSGNHNIISLRSTLFKEASNTTYMFLDAINLHWVDCPFSRTTKAVGMFDNCEKLEVFDMVNLRSVQQADDMFAGCTSLLYILNSYVISSIKSFSQMFINTKGVNFCTESYYDGLKTFLKANANILDRKDSLYSCGIINKNIVTYRGMNFYAISGNTVYMPFECEQSFYNLEPKNYLFKAGTKVKIVLTDFPESYTWKVPDNPNYTWESLSFNSVETITTNSNYSYDYSEVVFDKGLARVLSNSKTNVIQMTEPPSFENTNITSLDNAFYATLIKAMPKLPLTIKSLSYAFYNTQIEEVSFKDNNVIENINYAFSQSEVKSAVLDNLPNLITAEGAFSNSPLENVTFDLPRKCNVKNIFARCGNLIEVDLPEKHLLPTKDHQDAIMVKNNGDGTYTFNIFTLRNNIVVSSSSVTLPTKSLVFTENSQELILDATIPYNSLLTVLRSGNRFGNLDADNENRLVILAKDTTKITTNLINITENELNKIVY